MLTSVAIVVVLLVALFAFAATRPGSFRVEREAVIDAPPGKVYPFIEDFHSWRDWSPWENIDPGLKRNYSGPASGVGAIYEWQGRKAGQGRMEILGATPDAGIKIKLDFIKPFEGHNTAEFTLTPRGSGTNVKWAIYGPMTFMGKVMSTFVSMDKFLGKEFEKGLANLRTAVQK